MVIHPGRSQFPFVNRDVRCVITRDKICVPSSKIKPFLFHASKPTSPSPSPPPPSSWESALVIYNLEPFHFLCNYETADNPARFIIHEAADVPHFSSLPPPPPLLLPLPVLQSWARKNAIEIARLFSTRGRLSPRRGLQKAGRRQMGHRGHTQGGGFAFILPLERGGEGGGGEETRIYVDDPIRSGN